MSFMLGYPLTAQLHALVRHALDGGTGPGLGGPDFQWLLSAFAGIADDEEARRRFQTGFSNLNGERLHRPSPAHAVLAELVHRGVISRVVSLNWDTRLEAAYLARYGRLPSPEDVWLEKPHGDAARPDDFWILPHEPGSIPDALVDNLDRLAQERPRILLIIGYSERDEVVVQRLINPLADRWYVCRVGPDAHGDLAIPLPAEEALPLLLEELNLPPETPGWEYVNFEVQRDLGSALAGRRLGPQDASACPRLPEVDRLKQSLDATNSGFLIGRSGAGKSISCYQVAFDHHQEGWEVIRLQEEDGVPESELEAGLANLPTRTLAVIDNAQRLSPRLLQLLLDKAEPRLRILAASTGRLPSFGSGVEIAEERAVGHLAEAFRARSKEILPIVRALDDRIGEGYMDERLDQRIDHAEATAKTPWEFSFTVAGGWRRAKDEVVVLREHDRTDLLLLAIAARQITSGDSAVGPEWLAEVVSQFGRDRDWLHVSRETLVERRAVLQTRRGNLRCPHARYAELVLRTGFRLPKDKEWEPMCDAVRSAILSGYPPLLGIHRLLFDLFFAQAFPWAGEAIVDDEVLRILLDRIWGVESGERGDAAYLLMTLSRWRKEPTLKVVGDNASTLAGWVDEAESDAAWGLSWLLNDAYNADPDLITAIAELSDPRLAAAKLARAAVREWPAWERLFSLLAACEPWRSEFAASLEPNSLLRKAETLHERDVPYFNYLCKVIARIDHDLGLTMVNRAAPTVAEAINEAPARVFGELHDLVWFILGYAPQFLRRRQPTPQMKRAARAIISCLDPERIAAAVSIAPRRDWRPLAELIFWVDEVHEQTGSKVVGRLDFARLDARAEGLWADFPHELKVLTGALARGTDREPARSWLLTHAGELERLDPMIAVVSPVAVLRAISEDSPLDLHLSHGLGWSTATAALATLYEVEPAVAKATLQANEAGLTSGLELPQAGKCEGLLTFLEVASELDSGVLKDAVSALDPEVVDQNWADRLRGRIEERRAVAKLLAIAGDCTGAVAAAATQLEKRFPSAGPGGSLRGA